MILAPFGLTTVGKLETLSLPARAC